MEKINNLYQDPEYAFQPLSEKNNEQQENKNTNSNFFIDGTKRFLKNKVALISLFFIVTVTIGAILIPIFWPYSYDKQLGITLGEPVDASYSNLAPFEFGETELEKIAAGEYVFPHIFGTDSRGRDYFIRVVYAARISLAVGFFASIIVLIIGLSIGAISGYFGGKVDTAIMRIVDIIYSLPDMLMVILLASVINAVLKGAKNIAFLQKIGTNIISLFIVFALLYWVSMARLVRGQILSLREQEYILSAKSSGARGGWIIKKHLIPNSIGVIVISAALQIPSAIFTESYLSFLGLGVNAPMPSLGSLASDALNGVSSYPQRLIIPAVFISLIVLALNLAGDGLRDAFDPKLA